MACLKRAALFCAALFLSADGAAAKTYVLNAASAKMRVVDGDTVHYGRLKFRLCGIQAPERFHPRYEYAARMLRGMLGRGEIRAHVADIDKYRRKVAVMFRGGASGTSINEKMVRRGGARHYEKYSANCEPFVRRARFYAVEKRARKSRRGIWKK